MAARIFHVAHDAEIFSRIGGLDAALDVARGRAGTHYDPEVAGRFGDLAGELLARLESEAVWDATLSVEPAPVRWLADDELDEIVRAVANFVDARSPYTVGHSPGVAALAEQTARMLGLAESEAVAVRRAGLLHDVGRTGVPVAVWDKKSAWTPAERQRAHTHPALTEVVLSRSHALGPLGTLASLHHERLDGSGYRGMPASFLPLAARILAAADFYRTKVEQRPHREALRPQAAAHEVRTLAHEGQLDADVAEALLGRRRPSDAPSAARIAGRAQRPRA